MFFRRSGGRAVQRRYTASFTGTRSAGPARLGRCRCNASAVRCPLPLTMKAIALPLAQPGRPTTCYITAARLGVRWFPPAWPALQAAGDHCTEALVRGREETLKLPVAKVAALSAACERAPRLEIALEVTLQALDDAVGPRVAALAEPPAQPAASHRSPPAPRRSDPSRHPACPRGRTRSCSTGPELPEQRAMLKGTSSAWLENPSAPARGSLALAAFELCRPRRVRRALRFRS
jgi:hypothetical protein